jgi:hypothetical protein
VSRPAGYLPLVIKHLKDTGGKSAEDIVILVTVLIYNDFHDDAQYDWLTKVYVCHLFNDDFPTQTVQYQMVVKLIHISTGIEIYYVVISMHMPGGTDENHEIVRQYSPFPARDSKRKPSERKSETFSPHRPVRRRTLYDGISITK